MPGVRDGRALELLIEAEALFLFLVLVLMLAMVRMEEPVELQTRMD